MKRQRERDAFAKDKRTHGGHGMYFNRPFQEGAGENVAPAIACLNDGGGDAFTQLLFPENTSELYNEGVAASTRDGQFLGINCCMVCGKAATVKNNDTECTRCGRVEYCNKIHKKRDRKAHAEVCNALYQIEQDEKYISQLGCAGDAGGFGDGTGIGGGAALQHTEGQDYAFTEEPVLEASNSATRKIDLAGLLWQQLQWTRGELPMSLGAMHRGWTFSSLLSNLRVFNHPLLSHPSIQRAQTSFTTCPLTLAYTSVASAPMLGTMKHILNPDMAESHIQTSEDVSVVGLSPFRRRVLTVHVLGASTLEASISHLPYWSLVAQAVSSRMNLHNDDPVPLQKAMELPGADTWAVRVIFIGLELPNNLHNEKALKSLHVSPHVSFAFFQGTYQEFLSYSTGLSVVPLQSLPKPAENAKSQVIQGQIIFEDSFPHIIAGFQLGLTVKDYAWSESLTCVRNTLSRSRCVQWLKHQDLKACNTAEEKENILSLPYLSDKRSSSFKTWVVTTSSSKEEAQMEGNILGKYGCDSTFVGMQNTLPSLQVLQSGTLANDVWYKNRYLSLYTLKNMYE